MSLADKEFIETCRDVLEHGTSTKGQNVRAHWPDGAPAYTIARFGVVNRFDLSKEFPAVTLRKTAVKTATEEILWIWQRKSNNIHDLKAHIWDEWADPDGSIGKAYGYQMKIKHPCGDVTEEGLKKAFPDYVIRKAEAADVAAIQGTCPTLEKDGITNDRECSNQNYRAGTMLSELTVCADPETGRLAAVKSPAGTGKKKGLWYLDQVDKVLYDLKVNPFSRRIMTTLWNPEDLSEMNLQPCAWSCTFMVEQKPGHDKLTLNMALNQRSQDILAAWAWNTVQYAVLQHMLAQCCDMEVGEMLHTDINCHIYDRHVDIIKELCSRTPQKAPDFHLNPDIHDFYKFTRNDVSLENYTVAGPQIKDIPIAI